MPKKRSKPKSLKTCPVCGYWMMPAGSEMCIKCRKNKNSKPTNHKSSNRKLPELMQTAFITLDDGARGSFTGKAIAFPANKTAKVVGIKFSLPSLLPANCSFFEIEIP